MPKPTWPRVTVVFLAYNRREELSTSLQQVLEHLDYPSDRLEVVVVDNASTDGTADMLARDFPGVPVIVRETNSGVSGWNDGFAAATGEYVLALDDDCYLPADGLRRGVQESLRQYADLVSFGVMSLKDPSHRFDLDEYRTGLLGFWGCAVLMRREVLDALGGFDPGIFIYAHEPAFMLRFYDRGFRHLYLPDVIAVHMKAPTHWRGGPTPLGPYRVVYRNWGYTAAKLLRARDAAGAVGNLLLHVLLEAYSDDRRVVRALPAIAGGCVKGWRSRTPVRAEVSRVYRRNLWHFVNPTSQVRSPLERLRFLGDPDQAERVRVARSARWYDRRRRYYPAEAQTLEI